MISIATRLVCATILLLVLSACQPNPSQLDNIRFVFVDVVKERMSPRPEAEGLYRWWSAEATVFAKAKLVKETGRYEISLPVDPQRQKSGEQLS